MQPASPLRGAKRMGHSLSLIRTSTYTNVGQTSGGLREHRNPTCRDLHGQVGIPVRPMDVRDHSTAHSKVIALPTLIEDRYRPAILHFAAAGLFQRVRDQLRERVSEVDD